MNLITERELKKLRNRKSASTLDEKRELMGAAIKQLNGHPGFEAFMDGLYELREYAIRVAVSDESVGTEGKTLAALGEIRAYEDIFALVDEQRKTPD